MQPKVNRLRLKFQATLQTRGQASASPYSLAHMGPALPSGTTLRQAQQCMASVINSYFPLGEFGNPQRFFVFVTPKFGIRLG